MKKDKAIEYKIQKMTAIYNKIDEMEDGIYKKVFKFLLDHYGHDKARANFISGGVDKQTIKCYDCVVRITFLPDIIL